MRKADIDGQEYRNNKSIGQHMSASDLSTTHYFGGHLGKNVSRKDLEERAALQPAQQVGKAWEKASMLPSR